MILLPGSSPSEPLPKTQARNLYFWLEQFLGKDPRERFLECQLSKEGVHLSTNNLQVPEASAATPAGRTLLTYIAKVFT